MRTGEGTPAQVDGHTCVHSTPAECPGQRIHDTDAQGPPRTVDYAGPVQLGHEQRGSRRGVVRRLPVGWAVFCAYGAGVDARPCRQAAHMGAMLGRMVQLPHLPVPVERVFVDLTLIGVCRNGGLDGRAG
ncbi:hypothetical protein RZS08_13885 [Arthrospira platensis SPKY1]|nr:hypothetical protein [Arthrospira platensis SPKY1]